MKYIIGIDEVGRGPVAGPVTVCAFLYNSQYDILQHFEGRVLKDSKKLSDTGRRLILTEFNKVKLAGHVDFTISSKQASYIDRHGISQAVQKCIQECLTKLCKLNYSLDKRNTIIHLDGALKIEQKYLDSIKQKYGFNIAYDVTIKGDEDIPAIACASIMAKITRDNRMVYLGKNIYNKTGQWYNWQSNVGYGTKEHYNLLQKHGLTEHHRKSFLTKLNLN